MQPFSPPESHSICYVMCFETNLVVHVPTNTPYCACRPLVRFQALCDKRHLFKLTCIDCQRSLAFIISDSSVNTHNLKEPIALLHTLHFS